MGVSALIRNKEQHWGLTTDGDGAFVLHQIPEGDYDVEIDEDSVPPGYLTAELAPQKVKVGAATPGSAVFTVRASRSISGKVSAYQAADGKYTPIAGRTVMLKEAAKTSITDASGRFMFRNLAAGSYTVAVMAGSREVTKLVKLPASPTALTNIDFEMSDRPVPTDVPAESVPTPVHPSQPPPAPSTVAAPVAAMGSPSTNEAPETVQPAKPMVTKSSAPHAASSLAEQHNRVGRQELAAGRYQRAIAELTEAIRLSPDYALAYNARGFAYYQMHDFSRAIDDLDKAIELNPHYVNAYQNRGVVKKAAGDLSGAQADLRREH